MSGFGRRRLYLMRHGHVDYFAPGLTDPRFVELTDLGKEQAAAAHTALADVSFDLVAHSGLPRTIATAAIVCGEENDKEPVDEPRLEELKSGWLQANSREELAARLAFCFDKADVSGARFLPDGETFAEAEARIVAGIRSIVEDHDWKTALVVAHEGVNRILLGWACGGGLKTIGAFEQDLCCINVVDIDVTPSEADGSPQVERAIIKAINLTPYDTVKEGLPRTSLEHLFGVDFGASRPSAG
ncbi:MAG: histidine phosphatase family protein [Pseudomonadota bacterium]